MIINYLKIKIGNLILNKLDLANDKDDEREKYLNGYEISIIELNEYPNDGTCLSINLCLSQYKLKRILNRSYEVVFEIILRH